jgi:cobalamin synthase
VKPVDAGGAALVVAVAVAAPASFQALTSAVVSAREHAASGGCNQDIRDAEIISSVVVALVGLAGAVVLRHPAPIIAAIAADIVMIGIYEYALRTQHDTGMNGRSSDVAAGYGNSA